MTLNAIAENIAYKLGDQFNDTLQQSIKETVISYRAKYIRDDLERNVLSEQHFLQTINIALEEVNLLTELNAQLCHTLQSCLPAEQTTVLRSVIELPTSVRLKNWGAQSYKFIGSADHRQSFVMTSLDAQNYTRTLKYQCDLIRASIINNRLYILNNTDLCSFALTGIYEDPRLVAEKCGNNKFSDETYFPIGIDMLMSLTKAILTGEYPLKVKDGNQINIKKDGEN